MAEHSQRLAIIGCGFMGSAILEGLLHPSSTRTSPKLSYTAHVNSPTSLSRLQKAFASHSDSITFSSGPTELLQTVSSADIILLGFLPKDLDQVLRTKDLASTLRGKTIISMLAGISTSQILQSLTSNAPGSNATEDFHIARIIPTLSAKIRESVTLLAQDSSSSMTANEAATAIFSRIGSIHPIPEKLMDTATAIGAAMHALAIVAVDSATDASVAEGLHRETALALTASCLKSCTALMLPSQSSSSSGESEAGGVGGGEKAMSPESVKAAMSTPGGITLNSIVHLDAAHVRSGITGTVREAVRFTKGMNE